ncbi:TetR/AcrR family transcriptional regulator [Paenibacillus oceani]|uniref:TetR/AcrR family transcriptional regulator n=1 Tax=Paenibacillus oceani TaxID=2772510 RepID=A0A927CJM1_9BACL|nr:TetR/AcrR family transcriptional regulator [Paenibacillus oceani]MBD2866905.1 TetR/AcrR family transcriptional regulator [Paenibacillus oceani]
MNGFERRTEHKKQLILAITKEKLHHDSFHTATIKEIAREASVSQVSIYNYFGSKDELLFEAIGEMMEEQLKGYEHLLEDQIPYPKLMYTVMTEEMKFVKVINDCMKQSADIAAMQERIERFLEMKFIPFLLKLIQRGREEQYVAEGLREDELLFYFNMYQKAMNQFQETGRSDHAVISEERFVHFFFKGLMGDMRD